MESPKVNASVSCEQILHRIRQDYDGSDLITVYRLTEGYPNRGYFIKCGLIPETLVEKMLSDKTYINKSIEDVGFRPSVSLSGDYCRFGSEGEKHGFEPLVISRRCPKRSLEYVEISQDFRLYHDLHHDREKDTYINADEQVIVEIYGIEGGYEVKIRLSEIVEYLTAKRLYLSLLFDVNDYFIEKLETLHKAANSERTFSQDNLICWVSHYRDTSRFSEFATNHYIRGRRFIAPSI